MNNEVLIMVILPTETSRKISGHDFRKIFKTQPFLYVQSLTRDTCKMLSSAPVGRVVFLRILLFSPSSDNDRLDISAIFLKGP